MSRNLFAWSMLVCAPALVPSAWADELQGSVREAAAPVVGVDFEVIETKTPTGLLRAGREFVVYPQPNPVDNVVAARQELLARLQQLQQAYQAHHLTDAANRIGEEIAALTAFANQSLPLIPPVGPVALDDPPAAYRGQTGKKIYVRATGSAEGAVWCTSVYTDDSDVGTAAVHAGVLKPGESAILQLTIVPGRAGYEGTTSNGVRSQDWGSFQGSFQVTGKGRALSSATELRGMSEQVVVYATGRTNGTVWGSDVYTDDSDIGTAAVHAGLLKAGESGFVELTPVPGLRQYTGLLRNGITTQAYGAWEASYVLSAFKEPGTYSERLPHLQINRELGARSNDDDQP